MKTTTRTRKRTTKPSSAPLGLQAIFAAMQPFHFQSFHGWTAPDAYVAVYESIRRTDRERDPHAFTNALAEAADQDAPGQFGPNGDLPASKCAEVAAICGFWSGVAACWHYMNAINGKDGAR